MIDYHCHLLPGLDDGPDSVEEALLMAAALQAFGFNEVCCTPHCIYGLYDVTPELVRKEVRALQRRLDSAGIVLQLHAGMEYCLDEFFPKFIDELLPLGATRLVLCEVSPKAAPGQTVERLELIINRGFIPLVAHPERNFSLWAMLPACGDGAAEESPDESTSLMRRLWSRVRRDPLPAAPGAVVFPASVLFQADLGSFTGYYGGAPRRQGYRLLQQGLYTCVASDLHDGQSIPGVLHAGREEIETHPALRELLEGGTLAG